MSRLDQIRKAAEVTKTYKENLKLCPACTGYTAGVYNDKTIPTCELCQGSGQATAEQTRAYWLGWNAFKRLLHFLSTTGSSRLD